MKWIIALFSAGALVVAPSAAAQCLPSDGLSGPCCSPVTPLLPTFPGVNTIAQGDCWKFCGPPSTTCMRVAMSPPFPTGVTCSEFFAQFTATDCGGLPLVTGLLTLDYMRTWTETPPTGVAVQVWRFAAKIDMNQTVGATPGCPIPECATAGAPAFYYGYVDYALTCGAGTWETAIVLFHNCDDFVHRPGLSSVPGTFHPGSTYAIVGPDTSANPFVPSIVPVPPPAAMLGEAFRGSPLGPPPASCQAEEPIVAGTWLPLLTGCTCPLSFSPGQNTAVHLDAGGACGSKAKSINLWPNMPWFEFTTTSIGGWTGTGAYPGPERVSVGEGITIFTRGCTAGPTVAADVVYGSITDGGWTTSVGSQVFVDAASNYSQPAPGPYIGPFVGSVMTSADLLYFNL